MQAKPPPRRLLIIDDEPPLRDLFRHFMEREGFAVEEAEDGEAGLAKASSRPDLIVLDIMMPRLNGEQVLHRLQDMGLQDIPVLVLTAFSNALNEDIIRQEPNVVDFIKKPVRYKELAARIRSLLDNPLRRGK